MEDVHRIFVYVELPFSWRKKEEKAQVEKQTVG